MVGATNQTLRPFLQRAGKFYPDREIVSRTAERPEHYTYAEYEGHVAWLAGALSDAGIGDGDWVATFCWNHNRHFETYLRVPSMGAQLHTINPLLPDHHIQYIVRNAKDHIIFVDPSLAPKLAGAVGGDASASVEQSVVMASEVPDDVGLSPMTDYESFIADHPGEYDWPDLPEDQPAGMCYTSRMMGQPKGVEYSWQMLWAHMMATPPESGLDIGVKDVIMPVVPMFHVNTWGLPFSMTAAGAKHVYPGPSSTPEDLATLIKEEGMTMTAGVPTVQLDLFDYLDEHDADISSLERTIIGGSVTPKSVIHRFDEEHDVDVLHTWGMTETSPVGTVIHLKPGTEDLPAEAQYEKRAKQGLLAPGLEMRVVDDDGNEVPWDDEEFDELWVYGLWVTIEYFERLDANEEDYEDDQLKTGDVVTVGEDGYVQIVDRAKDVTKSGGEWISSLELENSIMAYGDVAEATVIGVPHERWQKRPVALIVPKGGVDEDTLKANLVARIENEFPKWWAPDEVVFIDKAPKTVTGKFDKKVLRGRYDDLSLIEGKTPDSEAPSDE